MVFFSIVAVFFLCAAEESMSISLSCFSMPFSTLIVDLLDLSLVVPLPAWQCTLVMNVPEA
jgi:hypothetical protein